MYTFIISLILLVVGYVVYGTVVEKVFGIEPKRQTPSYAKADGVDYIPMSAWRVFLIQFLNIAGTGPIFGAIMGILFGPAAYLWIVLGCIFAGAVHDYLCGMISLRKGGVSLPEIVGDELGNGMRQVIRVFSIILLVLVGAVFVTTPADLLDKMTADVEWTSHLFWIIAILLYFLLATLLPIDKLIGRVYPLFGLALLIMAFGVGIGIFTHPGWMPEITDSLGGNHPKGLPVFPMLCITIACGAISGFHGTQSPLMSRCLENERHGRSIFYGAMITEGIVALIWAAASIKFAGTYKALGELGTPAVVVSEICTSWLGTLGAILAVLGVVAAPITSGDTAFRSARLIAADILHSDQHKISNRLLLSIPLFVIAVLLIFLIGFDELWRYFAWSNQTLATVTLWASAAWLARRGKCYWIALVPALFMTVVCTCYILVAPEGFGLTWWIGMTAGIVAMLATGGLFARWQIHKKD